MNHDDITTQVEIIQTICYISESVYSAIAARMCSLYHNIKSTWGVHNLYWW